MLEQFEKMGVDALAALNEIKDEAALEQFRIKYLGKKGQITRMLTQIGSFTPEQKPKAGQLANKIKKEVTEAFEQLKKSLSESQRRTGEFIDVTLPGVPVNIGKAHVITQTINELLEIFGRMGFDVAYGPEVEDEWHNFVALNIPPGHPARDPMSNFYLDDGTLLRSQTSTIQIRVMEHQKPPIRIVAPGRVYRPDTVDATHMYMFYQIEALAVDEGLSMVDKNGKKDWMEVGGCGMVDPNVFDAVGIDNEKYTGWAFGFGIERLAMRKYGITDIRLLFENDLRFLSQF
ncbi:MAG: phenylalanine--tRNA ligase subunit alpha [Planctomycetota bacterium]|jgi:phenylalanyl-tRNA synthetase alpha chain